MTTRLTLLCHAPTSAARASAFPADEPLDGPALQKLAAFPRHWCRADRCWTSPARRASQTATALHLDAATEPTLRDCDYGRWTGRSFDEVCAQDPAAVAEWMRDPAAVPHGGESLLDLMGRVGQWLDAQNGIPGRAIALTHAAVIRAAVVHAIGAAPHSFWRIDVAPLSRTMLSGNNGRWNLVSLGEMPDGQT
jgi:broad specificity phosphatase PhoE